jgi:hypothetical protein
MRAKCIAAAAPAFMRRADDTMIAAFRGHSRVIDGTWLEDKA